MLGSCIHSRKLHPLHEGRQPGQRSATRAHRSATRQRSAPGHIGRQPGQRSATRAQRSATRAQRSATRAQRSATRAKVGNQGKGRQPEHKGRRPSPIVRPIQGARPLCGKLITPSRWTLLPTPKDVWSTDEAFVHMISVQFGRLIDVQVAVFSARRCRDVETDSQGEHPSSNLFPASIQSFRTKKSSRSQTGP